MQIFFNGGAYKFQKSFAYLVIQARHGARCLRGKVRLEKWCPFFDSRRQRKTTIPVVADAAYIMIVFSQHPSCAELHAEGPILCFVDNFRIKTNRRQGIPPCNKGCCSVG